MPHLRASTKARLLGVLLIVGSIAVTIWLGIRGASKDPPSLAESSVLVVFAAALQISGGATFAKIGRADPSHARSAVRRLHRLAQNASDTKQIIEEAVAKRADQHKAALGEVKAALGEVVTALRQTSVTLSYIEEMAVDAIEDWNEFHKDALAEMQRNAAAKGKGLQGNG